VIDKASYFWMDGRLARGLLECSTDLTVLEKPGPWVLYVSYEGDPLCLRFESIEESEFPSSSQAWEKIATSWSSTHNEQQYQEYVRSVRDEISQGEIYQANACRILSNHCVQDLAPLFEAMLTHNPAPYAAFLTIPQMQVASASPELFLRRVGDYIHTSPIKGTSSKRSFGEKDCAENVMITDLMRNDFGRICIPGSIDTPRLLGIEEHPGLFHLVSDVSGQLRSDISWSEILEALLPVGSISGAPKSSAISIIEKMEVKRGPYCGVMGWVNGASATLSVLIRTFWSERSGEINFGSGAGITWGSDPMSEWNETVLKAKNFMSIAGGW
jgi:para-aminobenzoate synthetase component 1